MGVVSSPPPLPPNPPPQPPLPSWEPPRYPTSSPPAYGSSTPPDVAWTPGYPTAPSRRGPAPGIAYAGFWLRLMARIIDVLIVLLVPLIVIGVIAAVVSNCLATPGKPCQPPVAVTATYTVLFFLVPAIYFPVLWAYGGTVGHRALGLRVLDASTGQRLRPVQSIGRLAGAALGVLVVWIGIIWIAVDAIKQGWHDKLANTVVVRRIL